MSLAECMEAVGLAGVMIAGIATAIVAVARSLGIVT